MLQGASTYVFSSVMRGKSAMGWLQIDHGVIYCPFMRIYFISVFQASDHWNSQQFSKVDFLTFLALFLLIVCMIWLCLLSLQLITSLVDMMSSAFRNRQEEDIVSIRMQKMNSYLNFIRTEKWIDLTSCLFGYVLANLDLSSQARVARDLKQQFTIIKEQLTIEKQLNIDEVGFIVFDLLNEIQKAKKEGRNNDFRNQEALVSTVYQNITGMMQNKQYVLRRWEREYQNQKNQRLIKKMLEEQERDQRRKAQEAQKKGWQCQVCLCEIDPSFMGILDCGHIFHPECLNGYLKAQIESNNLDIRCPMESCSRKMEVSDINQYIDGQLKQKFQKFSFNKYVESNSVSMSWCPTAGCTAAFQFDAALDNYRCPACKKHYCLRCKCNYHTGMSCAEYRVNNSFGENDKKFEEFVRGAKFKQCPKCNFWVERSQGCSSMTCKCGQSFCYDCGGTGCPHGRCSNSGGGKRGLFDRIFR